MADNIQIVGTVLSSTNISRYSSNDAGLISTTRVQESFGGENDYIEYFIFDTFENILNTNFNYRNYKLPSDFNLTPGSSYSPNTTGDIQNEIIGVESVLSSPTGSLFPIIEINPVQDLQDNGYTSGQFKVQYNIFERKISSYLSDDLIIQEISPDRTEIRIISTVLSDNEIESYILSMIGEIENTPYRLDYLLNLGNNEQYLIVNVALNRAITGYEILFKLYEPLPLSVQEKQSLWVVREKVAPYVFDINLDKLITPPPPPQLYPNFDIDINSNQGTISSGYKNYSTLVSDLQSLQSSSYSQLLGLVTSQSININVDYTNFDDFVFFGSAYQRVSNFYDKVKQIEDYNTFINNNSSISSTTPSLITEINKYSSSINDIVSKFDGYERYLYFESSSYAYPKSTSTKPYSLLSTSSATVSTWYNNTLVTASAYDKDNLNNLIYAIPAYIRDSELNDPFLLFLNMMGHYFDNIWIYLRSITDINLTTNNLDYGISKDLVYERLKSLGLHLYNSQAGNSVSNYLLGANTGSSTWDNNTTITGSYLNNIPRKDLVAELYKRIYHNLPLLLKQKGTVEGLNNLMTIFGIPNKDYYYSSCGTYQITASYGVIPDECAVRYIPCGKNEETEISITPPETLPGNVYVNIYANDTSVIPYFAPQGDGVAINKISSYGETYYSPAVSSNYTASILNVKEYGGANKAELIKGYNNDKVRIVQNSVTGSNILSPHHSLQVFPTDPAQFRDEDTHYVDISFSPQNQIDTYISKSISSNNPTWSLDDYIGDPRQQYSSSYIDLDAQRKLYFQTGVPGYAPFTASALDYNGFIRLVEYFDNSLFKMLADFVPERASLSTGVTFNSPVLERNKVIYANPTATTTQSVHEAEIPVSTIGTQYGTFYNALSSSNNTMGWFDGELSGSIVDVNQYFEDNYNPYLQPTGTIDQNFFQHSDWNVLLNNVSKSVQSSYRKKVDNYNFNYALTPICYQYTITSEASNPTTWVYRECIPGGLLKQIILPKNVERLICSAITPYCISGCSSVPTPTLESECTKYNITLPAELQDSYLSLQSYNRSRYEGSKLTSLKYNIYTSASYTGSDGFTIQNGDKSYGKTAVINRQSYKVGWVKNIPSQSLNFIDKTQIQLKYLVDKNSNITELNQSNNNIFEIQNTFKSGDNVVLSISDPIKPSFQKPLDGLKSIFKGGYSYDPILYRERNEDLTFTYVTPAIDPNARYFGYKAEDLNFYGYKNTGASLWDIRYSSIPQGGDIYRAQPTHDPVNESSPTTNYGYSFIKNYTGWGGNQAAINGQGSYETIPMAIKKYSRLEWNALLNLGTLPYTKHDASPFSFNPNTNNDSNRNVYEFDFVKFNNTSNGYLNGATFDNFTSNGKYLFKADKDGTYTISGGLPFLMQNTYFKTAPDACNLYGWSSKIVGIIEKCSNLNPSNPSTEVWDLVVGTRITNMFSQNCQVEYDQETNVIHWKPGQGLGSNTSQGDKDLHAGFYLEFLNDITNSPITSRRETNIFLREGNALRFRLFWIDLDSFFTIGKNLRFEIGKPNLNTSQSPFYTTLTNIPIADLQSIPYPNIQIIDKNNEILNDNVKTTFSGKIFINNGDNNLIFSPSMSAVFNTSSVFTPTSNTSNYYSPIIDTFSIKPNDLIRIGSINSLAPDYYDVISVNEGSEIVNGQGLYVAAALNSSVTINGYQYSTISIPTSTGATVYPISSNANYTSNTEISKMYNILRSSIPQFKISGSAVGIDFFGNPEGNITIPGINPNTVFTMPVNSINPTQIPTTLTGPGGSTVVNMNHFIIGDAGTISSDFNFWQYSTLYGSPNILLRNNLNTNSGLPLVLVPQVTSPVRYKVTLDRNIPIGNINPYSNFAVLRPKLDETSVIINFKKQQGNVSQTLLIPQDANDEIKNNTGRIYQNLNTDLSNQNI